MIHKDRTIKKALLLAVPLLALFSSCVDEPDSSIHAEESGVIVGTWTDWLNVTSGDASGDNESRTRHDWKGLIHCRHPTRIECRTVETKVPALSTDKRFEHYANCSIEGGLVCSGGPVKHCVDYEVRYLCPAAPDHNPFPDFESDVEPPPTHVEVGSLDGELSVDGNGQSNYKMSLRVPPGTGGVAPNLAVVYQSGGSDGVLGKGWKLLGPSVISVAASTRHYNQRIAPIKLNNESEFDLDGQRLVKVSSTADVKHYIDHYRTVVESRVRVQAYRPKTPGSQPTHFVVLSGDQVKRVYGGEESARLSGDKGTLAWYMDRTEDQAGNAIDYNYETSLLRSIDYTGNERAKLAPYNHIDFLYETRPDTHVLYAGGMVARRQDVRLRKIQMRTGPTHKVREYRFGYGRSKLTGVSQLESIQEVIGLNDGETLTALSPTKFGWRGGGNSPLTFETALRIEGPEEEGFQVLAQGDYDGDSQSDFVLGPVDEYGRIKSSATMLDVRLSSAKHVRRSDGLTLPTQSYPGYELNIATSGDFDGDGITDLLFSYVNTKGVWQGEASPVIYFGNKGGNFEQKQVEWISKHSCMTSAPKLRGTGDFNGDGATDLLLQSCIVGANPGPRDDAVKLRPVPHDLGFGTDPDKPWKVYVAELNGDGKSDIIVERTGDLCNARQVTLETFTNESDDLYLYQTNKSNDLYLYPFRFTKASTVTPSPGTRTIGVADFNGDGLSDVLLGFSSATTTWCQDKTKFSAFHLRPSKGDGTLDNWVATIESVTQPVRVRAVGDHDGDGKGDLHAGDKLYAYNGKFFEERPAIPLTDTEEIKIVGDITGNGVPDFIVAATDDKGRLKAHTDMQPFLAEIGAPDEMTTIVNGLGSTTTIVYARLTEPGIYNRGEGAQYPQRDFYSPLTVVSEVQHDTTSPYQKRRPVRYQYGHGLIDVSQQRFLGFGTMKTTDAWKAMTILETFAQGFPCMGMLKKKEVTIGGKLVRVEEHNPAYRTRKGDGISVGKRPKCSDLSPAERTTYSPYDRLQTESRWEFDGTLWDTKTQQIEIDSYGNTKTQETTSADGSTKKIVTEYEYIVDNETWIPGRVSTRETISTKAEDIHERKMSYQYSDAGLAKGRVEYETRDEGTEKEIILNYAYDVFGNITETTWGEQLKGKYVFDSTGRFPVCTENALGHIEYHEYSEAFGVETRVIDANTLARNGIETCPSAPPSETIPSTDIKYDGFGRKTKEMLPALSQTERVEKTYRIERHPFYGYQTVVTASGAPTQIRHFNRLQMEVSAATGRQAEIGDGEKPWSVSLTKYDRMGRVTQKSNTFASNNPDGELGDEKLWDLVEYDALDRVTRATDFANVVTTKTYHGRTHTVTLDSGPEGKNLTEIRKLDALGNTIEVVDDAGGVLVLSYDAGGRLTQSTAAGPTKSVVTQMKYDIAGNRTALLDPNLGSRTYQYDIYQRLTLQSDGLGSETTMEYDTLGRMTKRTSPEGVEEWVFDRFQDAVAIGKMMKESGVLDGLGSRPSRTYGYDELGRLTKTHSTVRGTNASVHHRYDDYGHVTRREYAAGGDALYDVEYKYDNHGFLVGASGSDGKDWFSEAKYTPTGEIRSYLDGAGTVTTKTYDEAKGLVSMIDIKNDTPLTTQVTNLDFKYSSVGNMTTKTTQRSRNGLPEVETFEYDRLNRITSYPLTTIKYDALGNITEKTENGKTQAFLHEAQQPNAVSQVGALSYEYNANGNMTKRGTTQTSWSSFDKPALMLFGGSDYTSFEYDAGRNRVFQRTRETSNSGMDMYADAEDGRESVWTRVDNGKPCAKIRYNDGGHLYKVNGPRTSGCRLSRTDESDWAFGSGSLLQWDHRNPAKVIVEVETSHGPRFLHYGWYSEDTLDSGEDLFFDVRFGSKEMKTILRDLEADLKGRQPEATFVAMTGFVVRGEAFIDNVGSPHLENQWTRRNKEKYYWFQDLERTDVFGETCTAIPGVTTHCSSSWSHGAYIVRIAGPEATTMGTITITEPHKGRRSYYHNDHLGSVIARTDDSGIILQRFDYDPWGMPVRQLGSSDQWPAYGLHGRGYSGHEMLENSKLIHMNGRIYDPAIGRFLSPDPIVKGGFNLQSHNRYSYVLNNPLINIDPSGHVWKKIKRFFKRAFRAVGRFFKRYGAMIAGAIAGFMTGGWALAIAPLTWGSISTAVFVGAVSGFASGFTGALVGGQGLKAALKAGLMGSAVSGVLAGVQTAFLKWIYEKFTPADAMDVELYRVRHQGGTLEYEPVSVSEVRGKSADIFVNGQSNEIDKAVSLGFERVQKDEFYLIHNNTVSGPMDTVESMVGKLTGRTPVSESTAKILREFDLTNSHIYAHSQGGIITRNALVLNHRLGQNLSGLQATFDGAAVNWASTSALFKTMGVSLPYGSFSAHPWDLVPNLTGYNALFPLPNPYRLVGSVLAARWVFKGGPGSAHTHVGGGSAVRWAPQLLFRP